MCRRTSYFDFLLDTRIIAILLCNLVNLNTFGIENRNSVVLQCWFSPSCCRENPTLRHFGWPACLFYSSTLQKRLLCKQLGAQNTQCCACPGLWVHTAPGITLFSQTWRLELDSIFIYYASILLGAVPLPLSKY